MHHTCDTQQKAIAALDAVIQLIERDTFNLTRDDHSSVEWRIRSLQDYINELYAKQERQ